MNKYLTITLFLIVGIVAGMSIYLSVTSKQKIAYVYNSRVLSEYKGVVEAKKVYEAQVVQWQSNLDTLSSQVRKDVEKYNVNRASMSESERQLTEELIQRKQNELMSYKKAIEDKASQNDQKMTAEVLQQVDSYIQEYGKKQGYDYILGVADNGNMLYAKDQYDLTDEIIKALNKRYEGE